jgi:hypothetical protein
MRIGLRDEARRKIGGIVVDPALRPTRVSVVDRPREVLLDWDAAQDDAGQLRRCVACGCPDLFREKAFPQVTGFVVVLAFIGAVLGALGFADTPPVFGAMILVLVLDIAIFAFSRQRLGCYRCRTTYSGISIARYHRAWDRALAEKYPAPTPSPAPRPAPGVGSGMAPVMAAGRTQVEPRAEAPVEGTRGGAPVIEGASPQRGSIRGESAA